MAHKLEIDGVEVDVFTTDEVAARETATRTAVEGEWKPKFETAEQERVRLDGLLTARAKEFEGARTEFKRLSEEQVAKLDIAQRTIYENGLALQTEREQRNKIEKTAHDSAVDVAISARVKGNKELFTKVKEMYGLVGLSDITPEQITTRVNAAFGALGQTAPDLLASAGFGGGGYEPPKREDDGKESFADSERGKAGIKQLNIAMDEESVKKELQQIGLA